MPLTPEQQSEIEALRAAPRETLRAVAPGMERHLHVAHPVLDHGFVRVVDYMGDDAAIVQAARVSYGRGTKAVSSDEGLIRYLMRHHHSTPFEMCEVKLHVKLPIFVARQWIRHRMANVNEISARYSVLDREFYVPAPEHLAAQSATNAQGRGEALEGEEAARVLDTPARGGGAGLRRLRGAARHGGPELPRPRARAHGASGERLHAVVLEGGPPQPPVTSCACAPTPTPNGRSAPTRRCWGGWSPTGSRSHGRRSRTTAWVVLRSRPPG